MVATATDPPRRVPPQTLPFPTARQLEQAVLLGTAVFVVAAALAAAAPSVFVAVGVGVSVVLFAVGCVTFLLGYARAVPRSRVDEIALGGLFFLSGTAPKRVQRLFIWCLVVEIVAGITAASFRPFTPVAFTTLAPMYALGLATLWGATFGAFPPRGWVRPADAATDEDADGDSDDDSDDDGDHDGDDGDDAAGGSGAASGATGGRGRAGERQRARRRQERRRRKG